MDTIKVTVPSEMYLSDLDCFHPGVLADAGFAVGYETPIVWGGGEEDRIRMTTTLTISSLLSSHQKKGYGTTFGLLKHRSRPTSIQELISCALTPIPISNSEKRESKQLYTPTTPTINRS